MPNKFEILKNSHPRTAAERLTPKTLMRKIWGVRRPRRLLFPRGRRECLRRAEGPAQFECDAIEFGACSRENKSRITRSAEGEREKGGNSQSGKGHNGDIDDCWGIYILVIVVDCFHLSSSTKALSSEHPRDVKSCGWGMCVCVCV